MSYATPADLLERYEADLVAQRAAPEGVRVTGDMLNAAIYENDTSAYSADEVAAIEAAIERMEKALADATEFVNSYAADRYTVPLAPLPQMVVRITCSIARFYLWGDEASKDSVPERDYKQAEKTLQAIRAGDITIGSNTAPVAAPGNQTSEVFGPERIFTRDSMRGL